MKDDPKLVTIAEMVEAMAYYRDDEPFRWFQMSEPGVDGVASPTDLLLVTMGQARREVGISR